MMLTKKDIACMMQVSVQTVNRWVIQGMPHIKIGRAVRFDREKVLEWIEQNSKK